MFHRDIKVVLFPFDDRQIEMNGSEAWCDADCALKGSGRFRVSLLIHRAFTDETIPYWASPERRAAMLALLDKRKP